MIFLFWELSGRETKILVIHAGLKAAIFGAKAEGLQMVSAGPDAWNPHSTGEHAPLERLPLFVRVLAGVLEELAAVKQS